MGSKRGILSHVGVPKDRERFVCRMCIKSALSKHCPRRQGYTLSVYTSQQRPRLADLTGNRGPPESSQVGEGSQAFAPPLGISHQTWLLWEAGWLWAR